MDPTFVLNTIPLRFSMSVEFKFYLLFRTVIVLYSHSPPFNDSNSKNQSWGMCENRIGQNLARLHWHLRSIENIVFI